MKTKTTPDALAASPGEPLAEIQRLSAQIRKNITTREPLNTELREINERLRQALGNHYDKGFESVAAALSYAEKQMQSAPGASFAHLIAERASLLKKHESLAAECVEMTSALQAITEPLRQARRAELTKAHAGKVAEIKKAIRSFCDDDEHAQEMAEVFPVCLRLNARINARHGYGSDAATRAANQAGGLLEELGRPIAS